MKVFMKKVAFYLLLAITATACSQLIPAPVPSLETEAIDQARISNPKKSPLNHNPSKTDVVVIQRDTLKFTNKIDTTNKPIGEQIFKFYDITSPDMSFSFPSHSVVMVPVTYVGIDKGIGNSFCEYWLYTKDGRLVCYCKNTVSGLHPVYANSFNTNNHLPEYTRKVAYGEYRLVYKNISKAPIRQDLIFGLILNEGKDQVDVKVDSGETKEFWIKVYPSISSFKLNNNNKEPI